MCTVVEGLHGQRNALPLDWDFDIPFIGKKILYRSLKLENVLLTLNLSLALSQFRGTAFIVQWPLNLAVVFLL